MDGNEKQSTREAWRRRQALTRRHGGRGRGHAKSAGRGRGQQRGGQHVVPGQKDRYREDDEFMTSDAYGAREDYGDWLATCAKDSQELLRRQRVALPDVPEYTRFVLETQLGESLEDACGSRDESLDLGAIGACLGALPLEVMLQLPGSERTEKDLVRRILDADPLVDCFWEDIHRGQARQEAPREEAAGSAVPTGLSRPTADGNLTTDPKIDLTTDPTTGPAAPTDSPTQDKSSSRKESPAQNDLAAELDAFLGLHGSEDAYGEVEQGGRSGTNDTTQLEDDLAWFDQL